MCPTKESEEPLAGLLNMLTAAHNQWPETDDITIETSSVRRLTDGMALKDLTMY